MRMKIPYLSSVLFGLMLVVFFSCGEDTSIIEVEDPVMTCETVADEGRDSVEVCYVPDEIITNTTGYSKIKKDSIFSYLTSNGFVQAEVCKCQQELIRWNRGDNPSVDVLEIIGQAGSAAREPGPSGGSAISANFNVSVPVVQNASILYGDRKFQRQYPEGDRVNPTGTMAHIWVIDTGVDSVGANLANHLQPSGGGPSCGNAVVDTRQGLDITNPQSPIPFDWHGHGTHVSGIAAAALDLTPHTNVMLRNVKVSRNKGSNIHLFDFLCSFYYALERGGNEIHVINCSLGWQDYQTPGVMKPILRELNSRGILLVVGAGNNGATECGKTAQGFWPASFSGSPDPIERNVVISVGAWDQNAPGGGRLWYLSSQCFDVAAPGVEITSSYLRKRSNFPFFERQDRNVALNTGTSMAAPFISYIAAGIKANNPNQTPAQIKDCIIQSASRRSIGGSGPNSSREVPVIIDRTSPILCTP